MFTECGGVYTASNGNLTSPLYPNPYPNDKVCEYLIQRPEGETITLEFIHFDIEGPVQSGGVCGYDFLKVGGHCLHFDIEGPVQSGGVCGYDFLKVGGHCLHFDIEGPVQSGGACGYDFLKV